MTVISYFKQLKRQAFKWFCVFVLLVVPILNTSMSVFALSATPTVISEDFKTGYHAEVRRGHLSFFNFGTEFNFIYADGQVVFCIQPGVFVKNGRVYTSTELRDEHIFDTRNNNAFSKEQVERIKALIFWGWDMSEDKSRHRYALVQSAIWRTAGWEFTRLSGNGISVSAVEAFEREVEAHLTRTTSFNNDTHTVKLGESITLTDTNGNLQYLTFENKDGWTFQHKGNSVTITPTANAVNTTIKTRNLKLEQFSKTSVILESAGSQTLVAFKDPERVYARLNLKVIKNGNIRIHKTDQETGANLSGVEFGVFEVGSNMPLQTAVTNAQGIVEFSNLEPKAFHIKETRTRNTYRLNEQVYSVTVPAGDTVTVNATNVVKKMKISVSKHLDEALDGSGTRVAGANIRFDIVNDVTGQVVSHMTTNANGYAISNDLPLIDGTYSLKEHTPVGYQATAPIVVNIDHSKDNFTYHYVVENNVKKSYLQLVKVDAQTKERIKASNIAFQLYKDNQLVTQHVTYPSMQTIDTFKTDNNGQVTLPQHLPYGRYEIQEVQAPTGYVLSRERIPVNITGDDTLVTVTIENEAQKGQLTIIKTGKQVTSWTKDSRGVYQPVLKTKGLSGVTFELLKDNVVVETVTSDNNGQVVFSEQPLGTYTYREVSAPEGFVIDETLHHITFTPQQQTVRVDSQSVSVHNDRKVASVTFTKAFENSAYFNNETVATFGLFTKNAVDGLDKDSLVGLVDVSKNGTYTFENLAIDGQFYLKEMTTGKAYELDNSVVGVTFDFASNGKKAHSAVVNTVIENKLKRGSHALVKVEANSKARLQGVRFELVTVLPNGSEKPVGTYTSDNNGIVAFNDLEFGRYYAKEVEALDGYLMNHNKLYFDVVGGEVIPTQLVSTLSGTVVENEKTPVIHTEATTQRGGKRGYVFEKHIERADLSDLTIGKTYTIVATQYDSTGKVYASQERVFVADSDKRVEYFEFDVPVGFTDDIVYGETLYRDGEKVAVHFDLKNDKQTVTVLQPKISTFARVGDDRVMIQGEKKALVDTLSYENFNNGQVIVRTWVVKYGTDEVIGEPIEQRIELNGNGEVSVALTNIDTSVLPVGKYTIMEQVFDVVANNGIIEKGEKIAEHVDNKDDNQSFVVKQKELPKTGAQSFVMTISIGMALIGLAVGVANLKD